jgi:hypothetical protein
VPGAEQAGLLVQDTVLNPVRFWREYGLAACASQPAAPAEAECESIWVPWNCLIGEGLVRYGYIAEAAELVKRLMRAITMNIQKQGVFRKHYNARTGAGLGERIAALGLPPLDLFLATLGVQIESIWRVHLNGRNPYPWPVILRFRGLVIHRSLDSTEITFPNGEKVIVDSTEPCVVDGK